jgi:hypothetical protein
MIQWTFLKHTQNAIQKVQAEPTPRGCKHYLLHH